MWRGVNAAQQSSERKSSSLSCVPKGELAVGWQWDGSRGQPAPCSRGQRYVSGNNAVRRALVSLAERRVCYALLCCGCSGGVLLLWAFGGVTFPGFLEGSSAAVDSLFRQTKWSNGFRSGGGR